MHNSTSVTEPQEDERDRLTWEALDDVDAGCVTDHRVVQEWAKSLGTTQSPSTQR